MTKIETGRGLKFAKTKWDISNWTKEQKVAFQEECFRLGYRWFLGGREIENLHFRYYVLHEDGDMIGGHSLVNFHTFDNIRGMKWEDMFPENAIKAGNLTNTINHDCSLYYSLTMDCCLKCQPEKDPRNLKNSKNLWGILNTARREQ